MSIESGGSLVLPLTERYMSLWQYS